MASNKLNYFILTGDPGVGKTTLTKKLCGLLKEKGVKTSGFYTEEVRNGRTREGFDVVTLEGARGRLARDQTLLNAPSRFKVGKYGVLVQEFESIALPTLKKPEDKKSILVIDEIGKMEFFSNSFKTRIMEIFSSSDCIILATIPVRKGDSIIENIRSNSRAKVWTVTRENRTTIHENILKEIELNFN